MQDTSIFKALITSVEPVDYSRPTRKTCVQAQDYAQWIDEWLLPKIVTDKPDIARINIALAELAKQLVLSLADTPKSHHVPWNGRGHHCLPEVFCQTVKQLMALQREIEPLLSSPVQMVRLDGTLFAVEEALYEKESQEAS